MASNLETLVLLGGATSPQVFLPVTSLRPRPRWSPWSHSPAIPRVNPHSLARLETAASWPAPSPLSCAPARWPLCPSFVTACRCVPSVAGSLLLDRPPLVLLHLTPRLLYLFPACPLLLGKAWGLRSGGRSLDRSQRVCECGWKKTFMSLFSLIFHRNLALPPPVHGGIVVPEPWL